MKVICAIDQFGWAFNNIADQIKKHFSNQHEVLIVPYLELLKGGESCDILLAFWWASAFALSRKVKCRRLYVGFYDHYSWRNVNRFELSKAFTCGNGIFLANEILRDELFKKARKRAPYWITSDGVDHRRFPRMSLPGRFTAGWVGNSKQHPGNLKGLNVIQAGCKSAGVPLLAWDTASFPNPYGAPQRKKIPQSKMAHAFYKNISIYICASSCEGTPNPVLEAMACGRPVITTPVGVVPKLVRDRVNGVLVSRSVEEIAEAIRYYQSIDLNDMSDRAYKASLDFAWEKKVRAFEPMLSSLGLQ